MLRITLYNIIVQLVTENNVNEKFIGKRNVTLIPITLLKFINNKLKYKHWAMNVVDGCGAQLDREEKSQSSNRLLSVSFVFAIARAIVLLCL